MKQGNTGLYISLFALSLMLLPACKRVAFVQPEKSGSDQAAGGLDSALLYGRRAAWSDSIFFLNELRTAASEADRLDQRMKNADFSPTGFYLEPGDTLIVKADQVLGSRLPVLLIGTYSRYIARPNPATYTLTPGKNVITDTLGGLLWLRYEYDPAGSRAKVTFEKGMKPAPFFRLGKTTRGRQDALFYAYGIEDKRK